MIIKMDFKMTWLILLLFKINLLSAQDSLIKSLQRVTDSASINKHKQTVVAGASFFGYVGSLYFLNKSWYANYPRSSFHTFNDNREWLQVDKVGHSWTAYQTSRALHAAWRWSGMPENKAVWIGTLSGFTYMTVIELLDAYSSQWGWSWGDVSANFFGASLFAIQQLKWKEQKMQMKFSTHKVVYSPELIERANHLYGKSLSQRTLKDYNAQTYWLSFNLNAFMPHQKLPPWLNFAVGYGAEGMFGASQNIGYDKNQMIVFDRRDIKRYRQWYLSPDVDFTKIVTRNKALKTFLSLLNAVKIPAPSFEYSNGRIKGHWLMF